MKKWSVLIFLFGSVFLGPSFFRSMGSRAETNPTTLTIGFLPGGDVSEAKQGALAIAQALQDEMGIAINVFMSKNYAGLAEAMKNKKVDFAFFTAMSYVVAEKETGAKVLLKNVWSEPFYYSVILSKAKSSLKKVEDLKGHSVAFVDEKSTSGYLYPQVYLKKKKIELKSQKMTGSHSASVEALDKGEVDAIAVFADDKEGKMNAYIKYSKSGQPNKDARVLWVSEPIPNDPFCVRQDFYDQYPKLTHTLMFALIDVVEKLKTNKSVQKLVGTKGFLPATAKQYDPVREVIKEMGLQ